VAGQAREISLGRETTCSAPPVSPFHLLTEAKGEIEFAVLAQRFKNLDQLGLMGGLHLEQVGKLRPDGRRVVAQAFQISDDLALICDASMSFGDMTLGVKEVVQDRVLVHAVP
jgi:hypothetical protein